MKKIFPYPFYLSFWFWWLVLTVVYIFVMNVTNYEFSRTSALLGMFVPVGQYGALGLATLATATILAPIVPVLVMLATIIFSDYFLYKWGVQSPLVKMLLILVLLFLLTLAVDVFTYHECISLSILKDPGSVGF
jgi:hypothetical protein